MAGLKEIRTRIASVRSTRKITSAMKMVAAAKLKKAQDRIIALRPYASQLDMLLAHLQQSLEGEIEHPLIESREAEKVLIVLFTSNRGLCGAFNTNAFKKARDLANEKYPQQLAKGNVHFYSLGKKGEELLNLADYKVGLSAHELLDKDFKEIGAFGSDLMGLYMEKKYDRIEFVYNRFKNAAVQELVSENFLPLSLEEEEDAGNKFTDYIFEPGPEKLIVDLVPKALKVKLFKVMLETIASEHGARMTAMHQATDNANELIDELTLHYNKARQAAITKEILDIVGGAEALN